MSHEALISIMTVLCFYGKKTLFVDFCTETLRTSSNRCISNWSFFSGKEKVNKYENESMVFIYKMIVGSLLLQAQKAVKSSNYLFWTGFSTQNTPVADSQAARGQGDRLT
jgi:hypothetical protein